MTCGPIGVCPPFLRPSADWVDRCHVSVGPRPAKRELWTADDTEVAVPDLGSDELHTRKRLSPAMFAAKRVDTAELIPGAVPDRLSCPVGLLPEPRFDTI